MLAWRLELHAVSVADLRQQLPFLKAHADAIRAVNIPHKSKEDDLRGMAELLQRELPTLESICVHTSIKLLYDRTPQRTYERLICLGERLGSQQRSSMLLVSGGGGRKRSLETVAVLKKMCESRRSMRGLPLAVAFNPHFPDEKGRQAEYERLSEKFKSFPGRVTAVYLQAFGNSDVQLLEQGLDYLDKILHESGYEKIGHSDAATSTQKENTCVVYGSVFVPHKRFLSRMRFRPWNGVFLSEEYLSSVEAAERITAHVLKVYSRRGVIPCVESAVTTDEDLAKVLRMLNDAVAS